MISMNIDNLTGRQIREYRVLEKLGQGGMASVFKVEHVLLRTFRAMKVIRPVRSQDTQYVVRFEREARVLVGLDHINLVRVYDFFQEEGCLFLIMEYVPGESMEARLRQFPVFSARDVIEILCQACEGLHVAHRAGIVHRDLSPDNVLIMPLPDGYERIKIIDFGIAKEVSGSSERAGQTELTVMGKFIGKLAYCSPEQAAGNILDQRSDIYSLGLVAHRALTGRIPFYPKSPFEALALRQVQDAPRLSEVKAGRHFPARLEEVVARSLKRDPDQRYQRILEFRDGLRDAMAECDQSESHTQFRTTNQRSPSAVGGGDEIDQEEPEDQTIAVRTPVELSRVEEDLDSLETASSRDIRWGVPMFIILGITAVIIAYFQVRNPVEQTRPTPVLIRTPPPIPTHTLIPIVPIIDTPIPEETPTITPMPTSTPEPLPTTATLAEQATPAQFSPTVSEIDREAEQAWIAAEKAKWAAVSTEITMVSIASGTFILGSDSSEQGHEDDELLWAVGINRDFVISATEITQAQYLAMMHQNPSRRTGPEFPVESVTWFDALEFCNALSHKEGLVPAYEITKEEGSYIVKWKPHTNGYRLPTEAEWEVAARAGTRTPFSTGERITQGSAHFDNTSGLKKVRTYSPNAHGLYDMQGSVWEWCWDGYGPYSSEPVVYPTGNQASEERVLRGGSWKTNMEECRFANRRPFLATHTSDDIGFRVARNP